MLSTVNGHCYYCVYLALTELLIRSWRRNASCVKKSAEPGRPQLKLCEEHKMERTKEEVLQKRRRKEAKSQ